MLRHTLARGAVVWLGIAAAESVRGTARALLLTPRVGDLASRQIGVFSGSLIILLIAWLAVRWIGARGMWQHLAVGTLWVTLMLTFELSLGRALGVPWARLVADYLPWQGGYMGLGMAVLALAPLAAAKTRGLRS